jgi:ubiquinone biosynthesis protein UbiJ
LNSGLEQQFLQQNVWNQNTQQGMETVAQQYDEISALQKTVAMLEAKVSDLCKAKPGRPKRQPQ